MARLSKDALKDHTKFKFKEREVEIEDLGGSLLLRSPSLEQREELAADQPDDAEDWSISNTAKMFSVIVVEPSFSAEEAEEFLKAWPAEWVDKVVAEFSEMMGTKEALRDAVGEFPDRK